jgi:hypothetical protein
MSTPDTQRTPAPAPSTQEQPVALPMGGQAALDAASAPFIELQKLRAEMASLRKDAERYRWLRDNPWPSPVQSVVVRHENAAWDATIDAAMVAAPGIGAA